VALRALDSEMEGLSINALLTEADNIPVAQAISAIADLASMRVLVTGDGLDAASPHSEAPYWTLASRDIISVQSHRNIKSFDGYSITYAATGAPAAGGARQGDIYSAECGAHSWLQINDYATAARLGERALMRPRWEFVALTRRDAVYAAPGSVIFVDAPEIGICQRAVVSSVAIDMAWQTLTLEEGRLWES